MFWEHVTAELAFYFSRQLLLLIFHHYLAFEQRFVHGILNDRVGEARSKIEALFDTYVVFLFDLSQLRQAIV